MESPAASKAKSATQSTKRKAFFARLFKSKFRIFAPFLKDSNAFKEQKIPGNSSLAISSEGYQER